MPKVLWIDLEFECGQIEEVDLADQLQGINAGDIAAFRWNEAGYFEQAFADPDEDGDEEVETKYTLSWSRV